MRFQSTYTYNTTFTPIKNWAFFSHQILLKSFKFLRDQQYVQDLHVEFRQTAQSIWKVYTETASCPQAKHVFRCALFKKKIKRT